MIGLRKLSTMTSIEFNASLRKPQRAQQSEWVNEFVSRSDFQLRERLHGSLDAPLINKSLGVLDGTVGSGAAGRGTGLERS